MAEGKYCKIDGAVKQIVSEYAKVGGVIVQGTVNCPKIGGAIKQIVVGEVNIFVCEQYSDRLYGLDREGAVLTGWPNYGNPGGGSIVDPRAVACDEDGNTYWACANNVYKYDVDGNWQWTYTGHTSPVYSIACAKESGVTYIYTGDYSGVVKRLLGPLGVAGVMWSKSIGTNHTIASIAVDASEAMVYVGTGFAADAIWGAPCGTGNFSRRWISPAGDVVGLAIDEGIPCLYAGTNTGYLWKLSTAGYVYYNVNKTGSVREVRIGHDGYGYYANGSGETIGKFLLADGGDVWTYSPAAGSADAMSCAVDEYGNVFATYRIAGSSVYNKVYRLNSSGVEQWDWQPYLLADMHGIAVTPGIKAAGF